VRLSIETLRPPFLLEERCLLIVTRQEPARDTRSIVDKPDGPG